MFRNNVFLSSADKYLGVAFKVYPGSQASSQFEAKNSAFFLSYNRELREPLVFRQGSPISIRIVRGSWGSLSSHCRANKPHLGLCPETLCSSQVVTGISGLHSRFTQEFRPHLELKQRSQFSSRVVMGISWSPLSGLKGVKTPVEF